MCVLSIFVVLYCCSVFFFFFRHSTAYEMPISDWSSDVCSSDLAGGSIGRAAALILARRGANVVVADIVEAAAEETVRLIRAEGGNAVYSHCDVSIEDNAWSTVELAITEFGRLDGAFNNAGLPPVNVPLHQLTSADFQR